MQSWIILFTLQTFLSTAFAQKVLAPRFSNEEQLNQRLNYLQEQQQAIDFSSPFGDLLESSAAQSALHLAITKIKTEKKPSLETTLNRIQQHHSISQEAKAKAVALENLYLQLDKERTGLRQLQALLSDTPENAVAFSQELSFYQLGSGMRIAEIGAGDPAFAKQVLETQSPKAYFINDIDPVAVQMMSDFFQLWSATSPVIPILGASRHTQLEGEQLDVIIIRNALHHFEELPEMLISIRKSLAPNGRLLLKETFIESCYGLCCPAIRSEKEILAALEKAGFKKQDSSLIHEQTTTWHLLEFSGVREPHH